MGLTMIFTLDTKVVYIQVTLLNKSTMPLLSLVGERMTLMENTGLSETLGVATGVKMVTSESRCTKRTLELKKTVLGLYQSLKNFNSEDYTLLLNFSLYLKSL